MHAQSAIEYYSVEDYRHWEGDWELIGGIPLAMSPSPVIEHQRLGARILRRLAEALDDCPHCEALYEIDVEFSRDTVVRPDVLVICFEPAGERLTRAPDLIFEILSPATARRDEHTKFQLYRDEGVRWYVLVDPVAARAKVYRLVDGEYRKVGDFRTESCQFELSNCTITFDFGRLWTGRGL
jgi:Uma2 family endonuclease